MLANYAIFMQMVLARGIAKLTIGQSLETLDVPLNVTWCP